MGSRASTRLASILSKRWAVKVRGNANDAQSDVEQKDDVSHQLIIYVSLMKSEIIILESLTERSP